MKAAMSTLHTQMRNTVLVGYLSGTLFAVQGALESFRQGAHAWEASIDAGVLLLLSFLFSRSRRPIYAAGLIAFSALIIAGSYYFSRSIVSMVPGIVLLFYSSVGFAAARSERMGHASKQRA